MLRYDWKVKGRAFTLPPVDCLGLILFLFNYDCDTHTASDAEGG